MPQVNPSSVMQSVVRLVRAEAAMATAIAVAVGASLVFLDVADDSAEPDGRAFDMALLKWLHPGPDHAEPLGPQWFDHAVRDITSLGSLAVLVTLSLVVLGYLLLQRKRLEAVSLVVALGGGLGLSETLKRLFDRSRPPLEWHAAETLNASFPSGHALLSTVFFLTLGVMLARATPKARLRAYVMAVAILLAFLVGASRIYLGVHWASDVFAGWSLGAAWAMTCWLAEQAIARGLMSGRRSGSSGDKAS
ncbi:MAG: phosphatase PAP2 family protein [Alphaproteobacteria bacterium]|nr:phosphatase PAP2 family protein [Alphaproteobacteria bacterium]